MSAPEADFDNSAKWTITIDNHDDAPIQLASIRLEMLERNVCFDATAGDVYTLFYGDSALAAPVYDYAALFVLEQSPAAANWELKPRIRPISPGRTSAPSAKSIRRCCGSRWFW